MKLSDTFTIIFKSKRIKLEYVINKEIFNEIYAIFMIHLTYGIKIENKSKIISKLVLNCQWLSQRNVIDGCQPI